MPTARALSPLETYRAELQQLADWDEYLRRESRLPGPRANLELLEAVIEVGDSACFAHLLALDTACADGAPPNTPDEFLTVCGVAGLGKLVAEGDRASLTNLRRYASDRRWRVREAAAIALQHWGDRNMPALVKEMGVWSQGGWLERRAVVAALAEPRLLRPTSGSPDPVQAVLPLFDRITQAVAAAPAAARRDEGYGVLRQALGYGWSVLVAAAPLACRPAFERWLAEADVGGDKDLRWIARENLKKNRLAKLNAAWVAGWRARLG